ncbi:DUF4340 domain-containing protein [candidate division KSB1 bacterium]|nr:DUF4340 domain-containing protein [candidate division KSB1 bacterium]
MKEKHLYYLAGVFVFLLIIYFVTKPRHTSVNLDEFVQTIVFGVSKEDVKNIEVYKESAEDNPIKLALTKQEDQWYLTTKYNCKAQESAINRLLDAVLEMTGKVRSTDPKHLEKYQITDGQGIHLLLKDEAQKPLANLIIGKKGEDYNTGFVRFAGKDKVYFVDKNVLSNLSINGDIDTLSVLKDNSFIDLEAVKQDKDKLDMVALVHKGKQMIIKKVERDVEVVEDSITTTKKEEFWVHVKGSKEIDLEKKEVDNFLRDVCKIRGQKVVDRIGNSLADMNKNSMYGLGRPQNVVVFKEKGSEQQQNVIMGKEYEKDKGYFMNVQYDGLVYHLSKSNFDKIFKWADDLPEKVKK